MNGVHKYHHDKDDELLLLTMSFSIRCSTIGSLLLIEFSNSPLPLLNFLKTKLHMGIVPKSKLRNTLFSFNNNAKRISCGSYMPLINDHIKYRKFMPNGA